MIFFANGHGIRLHMKAVCVDFVKVINHLTIKILIN